MTPFFRNKRFVFKSLLTALVLAGVIILPGLRQSSDTKIASLFRNLRGQVAPDSSIVLITISANDIEQLGGWPLKRSYYALLINELKKFDVKKIGIEIFFGSKNSAQTIYDNLLISQIKGAGNVVLGSLPIDYSTTSSTDTDETIEFPSLKLVDSSIITGHLGLANELTIPMKIGEEKAFSAAVAQSNDTGFIKVNISSSWKKFKHFDLLDFFTLAKDNPEQLETLKDKILLIGVSDEKFTKKFDAPFDAFLPGIAFHAFAVSNLLLNNPLNDGWLKASVAFHFIFLLFVLIRLEQDPVKCRKVLPVFALAILLMEFMLFTFWNYELHFSTLIFPLVALIIAEFIFVVKDKNSQFADAVSESTSLKHLLSKKENELSDLKNQFDSAALREKEILKEKISLLQKEIALLEKQDQNDIAYTPEVAEKGGENFHGILYRSKMMRDVVAFVKKAAPTNETILVLGESGTGKELIAKAIHQNSQRKDNAFVAVNCGALSETLLESELFGHVKGAFTGAAGDKIGRFEAADKGTIFLDEIGETSDNFQVKLLRVLQSGEFEKVGSSKTSKVDVRVIAATNKKLDQLVAEKKFRADLFYRLNVFPIQLPPLRERKEDIPEVVTGLLKQQNGGLTISKAAMEMLVQHEWRGNVRELESALKRAFVFASAERRNIIQLADLPEEVVKEKRLHYEELVLDSLREKQFSHSAFSETANELEVNRTVISENLRGLVFKFLVKNEFDIATCVAEIAGTTDKKVLEKVRGKVETFLTNIQEDVKKLSPQEFSFIKEKLQSKYKNLPKKFHPYLDEVIKQQLTKTI